MKVSLNWLRDYLALPDSPARTGEVLTALGLEVEGQEDWVAIPGKLAGVVVGEVLTCVKHPNADKLSLTTVDIGAGEPVQIVCGAPNVAAGQRVPVATVGTTLHPSGGEAFKIKKGKIRGEVSMGMICAEDELGLGPGHDGILVLDGRPAPGTLAGELFDVAEDVVYEVGLTPNRSDATSHRGVAADLAAYYAIHGDHAPDQATEPAAGVLATTASSPDDASPENAAAALPPHPLTVEVLAPDRARRYAGVVLSDVTVGPSPRWLVDRLAAIGVRSINNVVDATNYILHDRGQPLHAFDLARVAGPAIRVQRLPAGTPFRALDGKVRALDTDDLVICDADDAPMCIAGVFGGAESGVTDATTDLFLEAAFFDARATRRSATRHDLRTDAARTFEKGVDPNGVVDALRAAIRLLGDVAGARVASEVYDLYPEPVAPARVTVNYARLAALAGVPFQPDEVKRILTALNFAVAGESPTALTVDVPTDRADVLREADVAEEVLRVYGFDNVPLPAHVRYTPAAGTYPSAHALRRRAAAYLTGRGLHEAMGLSLVPSRVYETLDPALVPRLVRIHNTSTVELDALRADLVPTGLQTIAYNQNRQRPDLAFFEFGRGYLRGPAAGERPGAPAEYEQLAIWTTGARRPEHWGGEPGATSFAHVRGLAEGVLAAVGVSADAERTPAELPGGSAFAYAHDLLLGGETAARIGRVARAWTQYFDTKSDEVYLALAAWPVVAAAAAARKLTVREPSRFPRVRRDLAVVVDKSVTFGQIAELTREPSGPYASAVELFDVFEDAARLGAGKRSYAIRFAFERPDRTLKDKEVDRAMAAVAAALDARADMEVRR